MKLSKEISRQFIEFVDESIELTIVDGCVIIEYGSPEFEIWEAFECMG